MNSRKTEKISKGKRWFFDRALPFFAPKVGEGLAIPSEFWIYTEKCKNIRPKTGKTWIFGENKLIFSLFCGRWMGRIWLVAQKNCHFSGASILLP